MDKPYVYSVEQEAGQPPLYYLPVALMTALVPNADDADPFVVHNSFFGVYDEFGLPYDNHNSYLHGHEGDFPYQGVALGVHLARLVSIAFGLMTLWAVSRLARAITPDRPAVGLLAAALVGSVPGFLYVHATITNDVAPILFVTLSLWMVARIVREGPRVRLALAGGAFAALTLLSKLNGAWIIGIVCLAIILSAWNHRRERPLRTAIIPLALSLGLWVLLAGGWIAFTLVQKDPLGLAIHATDSQQNPFRLAFSSNINLLDDVQVYLMSTWYSAGWSSITGPGWIYETFDQLYLVGMLGAIGLSVQTTLRLRKGDHSVAAGFVIAVCLALAVGFAIAGGAYWRLVYGWRLGRLLYPGLVAAAVLAAIGWVWLLKWLRHINVAHLAYWGLAVAIGFALLRTIVVSTQNTITVLLPNPLISSVTGNVRQTRATFLDPADGKTPVASIVGYRAAAQDVRSQGIMLADICWQSYGYTKTSFPYSLQLVGPNDVRPGTRNSYHGLGSYPMSAWKPNEQFCDPSSLRVTMNVDRPRAYNLVVTLFQLDPLGFKVGAPLQAVDGAGRTVYPVIGRMRVAPEQQPVVTPTVSLGDVARLVSSTISLRTNQTLSVTLRWLALQPTAVDEKVFLHVVDKAAGQVVAQDDHEPDEGWFPTNYWQPRDVIDDSFSVSLPKGTDLSQIELQVGMYDPQTGARLAVVDLSDGQRYQDDAVTLKP
ncbi:MAG TPA: glycosyltransferase family 39 protein, partial [Anaerolineae bacterium]